MDTPRASTDAVFAATNQPLNLGSGFGAAQELDGVSFNTFISSFSTSCVTGTITAEVFANAPTPGAPVTDVLIRYTFENTGPNPFDTIQFGTNNGAFLDVTDLTKAATSQGTIIDSPFTLGGQLSPAVSLDVVNPTNNTVQNFDFVVDPQNRWTA